ncbi:MAG: GNAT family N-acetyltransferase [Tissierellia bacterium]|nr:GNAT family N-acetyltransferase [Tissierellia bacterium]
MALFIQEIIPSSSQEDDLLQKSFHFLYKRTLSSPQDLKDRYHHKKVYGLYREEDLLGFFTLAPLEEGACLLEDLFILPDYRGQGYGRALLGQAGYLAKAAGYKRLLSHARAACLDFLKKEGYQKVDKDYGLGKTSFNRMEKDLAKARPSLLHYQARQDKGLSFLAYGDDLLPLLGQAQKRFIKEELNYWDLGPESQDLFLEDLLAKRVLLQESKVLLPSFYFKRTYKNLDPQLRVLDPYQLMAEAALKKSQSKRILVLLPSLLMADDPYPALMAGLDKEAQVKTLALDLGGLPLGARYSKDLEEDLKGLIQDLKDQGGDFDCLVLSDFFYQGPLDQIKEAFVLHYPHKVHFIDPLPVVEEGLREVLIQENLGQIAPRPGQTYFFGFDTSKEGLYSSQLPGQGPVHIISLDH